MTEFLNFPNSGLFLLFSIIATGADIAMFYLAIRFAIQRLPEILEKTRNPLYKDRYSDKEEMYAYRNKMIISQPEMKKINSTKDYTDGRVPEGARRSNLTLFMIMLGFTFFSASMWAGQNLADGLNFKDFIITLIVGGIILGAYTGALGYIGAESDTMLNSSKFIRVDVYEPSLNLSFCHSLNQAPYSALYLSIL